MKKRSNAMVASRLDRLIAIEQKQQEALEQIQRLLLSKWGEVTFALTQEDAVRRIAFACRDAGIGKRKAK